MLWPGLLVLPHHSRKPHKGKEQALMMQKEQPEAIKPAPQDAYHKISSLERLKLHPNWFDKGDAV